MSSPQPLILIVDDNKDILFHLRLILEDNDYNIKTAMNGRDALTILSELESIPDIIISDIMMPEMDGYDFFIEVSSHHLWNRIPFIFLTAKITPEEIRYGKYLGVDDYLTKPFNPDDLLAIIRGKIDRSKTARLMNKEVQNLLSKLNIDIKTPITENEKEEIFLFSMEWDDKLGPTMASCCVIEENIPFSLKEVGNQLFYSANSIYGQEKMTKAEGVLLNIENINRQGYIYFDSYPDRSMRSGERQFMLAVISPKLNYFDSLLIKALLKEISDKIKQLEDWDIEEYREQIIKVLSEPLY